MTLFCGPPGAGKSTLARRLEAEGHGVRLCTDDWQAELGVDHRDTAFHERLQPALYHHALTLLGYGVSVILEDGLWTTQERAEKFGDARARGARIVFHVFDVPYETLWARLDRRNHDGGSGAYPITEDELRWACTIFQRPSPEEIAAVDSCQFHTGGRG